MAIWCQRMQNAVTTNLLRDNFIKKSNPTNIVVARRTQIEVTSASNLKKKHPSENIVTFSKHVSSGELSVLFFGCFGKFPTQSFCV